MSRRRRPSPQPKTLPGNPSEPAGLHLLGRRYLEDLRVNNYAKSTIETRRRTLAAFIRWADDRGVVRATDVTRHVLERYQRFLFYYRKPNGKPLSTGSQYSRLVPLRAFFKWLTRHHYLLHNPASELELPKLGHRLPKNIRALARGRAPSGLPCSPRRSAPRREGGVRGSRRRVG